MVGVVTMLLVVIFMSKQKVKVTTKGRRRKTGGNSGYKQCNMCHGTGRVRSKR